jgi:DNA polymerase I-like protein with 3'-5' exonuclease and polymerase domains
MVLARLVAIAEGKFKSLSGRKGAWALDGVASRFKVELEINKGDVWRLRYGTLYAVDLKDWPKEAISYALTDAVAARAVYHAIHEYAGRRGIPLDDGPRQARAAFWLRLMECRGVRVDRDQVEKYILEVEEDITKAHAIAYEAGFIRQNGTKDTKAAKAHMLRLCRAVGVEPPTTETGEVSLDKDAIDQYGDERLEAYATFTSASTLRKRVAGLRTNACIQASYEPIIDTGRTSCRMGNGRNAHGAQMQNPPKQGGFRNCFVARPGFVFSSVDYQSMELATFAFCCLKLVGFSRMADIINKGGDINTVTGAAFAGISAEEGYARRRGERGLEAKTIFDTKHRALGKTFSYGGLGGMGAGKLAIAARKQAGIELTLQESRYYLQTWKRTYPEVPEFFAHANRLLAGRETATVRHLVSGRMRGGVFYCQILNGFFQGLAADIAKDAGWRIARECYTVPSSPLFGSRLCIFLHDEHFLEVREDCMHDAAMRQAQIMVETAEQWCPGVKFSATPALMRRWDKHATDVYRDGRLVPWVPLVT